jgi:hypothetical protein
MNVMRFTVIDGDGAVSFVESCDALPLLVSACAEGAARLADLLNLVSRRRPRLRERVESGLAVFDEHNASGEYLAIHGALRYHEPHETPVFRVVDETTRQASLQAVKAGIVIFNLRSRRIVQIQNTYSEIRAMQEKVQLLERAGWRILP